MQKQNLECGRFGESHNPRAAGSGSFRSPKIRLGRNTKGASAIFCGGPSLSSSGAWDVKRNNFFGSTIKSMKTNGGYGIEALFSIRNFASSPKLFEWMFLGVNTKACKIARFFSF